MIEIDVNNVKKVTDMFSNWEFHMSIDALSENRAFAKAYHNLKAAALCFGVRLLIEGDPEDPYCVNSIKDFFNNIVLDNKIDTTRHFFMVFWNHPKWQDILLDLLKNQNPRLVEREYYVFDAMNEPLKLQFPDGYQLRIINEEFLGEELKNKRCLQYEMCSERVSIEDFLKNSFGVCALYKDEIAGWCLSEYNNKFGCEVGIEVMEEHQKKGVGTCLTLALVNKAIEMGIRKVGWSCYKNNLPSRSTAIKAGFKKVKEDRVIVVQR